MAINIAKSLRDAAEKHGDKIGLIEVKVEKKLTFAQIEKRSDDYAWYFKKTGVVAGDRVMLMVKPSLDFICLTFALFKLGSPVILIDPGMGYMHLRNCIANVQPKIFIGIPRAHAFFHIARESFRTVKKKFCHGWSMGIFGPDISKSLQTVDKQFPLYTPAEHDLAAIIFTTGSTGPPKGVRYQHSVFSAQLRLIREYYKISETDVDQPAFPLFALFSTALGACAVIPDMDATRPAKVNPKKFIDSLIKHSVTYSFGSPALWNVVSRYCHKEKIILPNVKKILMAGAPVSGELVERVRSLLPADAEIHTPYGATESLPIVSLEGREIIEDTWPSTRKGKGTCVGRALPGIDIKVITLSDQKIVRLEDDMILHPFEIGEIIVSGDVVTRSYDNNEHADTLSKIIDSGKLWHRMGDTGYLDDKGRLWFCGRKAHRVQTADGTLYTIPCEAIINNHPDVFRSALVGINKINTALQKPVIIIELKKHRKSGKKKILAEVKRLAQSSPLTANIDTFLFHHNFPVDIRHNAKIFREKLSSWAQKKLIIK